MDKEQLPVYFIDVPPRLILAQKGQLPKPPYTESEPPPNRGYQSPQLGWFDDLKKNKPQFYSLAAAVLIFMSGGMNLSWSLGNDSPYLSYEYGTHVQICWFVGVLIGACVATAFINKVEKRIFNLWASALVAINGIFFVSGPDSEIPIVFGRYCDGIALGMTIITSIIAGSEQAVKQHRGRVMLAEPIGITTGITIVAFISPFWLNEYTANQIQGSLSIVFGVLALLCTNLLTIESPIFFLRRENEQAAINCLKRLQTPTEGTDETYSLLYENKHLLIEDVSRGHTENISRSYVPLVKLCIYRALVSMSYSLPLNWGLMWILYYNPGVLCLHGIIRLLGVTVTIFTMDTIGRRTLTAVAMFAGAILLIITGSLFEIYSRLPDSDFSIAVVTLLLIYQFLSGIAAPASTVYLGEAFSISLKPFFILGIVIFETIIQILICCVFESSTDAVGDYGITLGSLQLVFAICFVVIMPDTKQTTLREALTAFKRHLNVVYE